MFLADFVSDTSANSQRVANLCVDKKELRQEKAVLNVRRLSQDATQAGFSFQAWSCFSSPHQRRKLRICQQIHLNCGERKAEIWWEWIHSEMAWLFLANCHCWGQAVFGPCWARIVLLLFEHQTFPPKQNLQTEYQTNCQEFYSFHKSSTRPVPTSDRGYFRQKKKKRPTSRCLFPSSNSWNLGKSSKRLFNCCLTRQPPPNQLYPDRLTSANFVHGEQHLLWGGELICACLSVQITAPSGEWSECCAATCQRKFNPIYCRLKRSVRHEKRIHLTNQVVRHWRTQNCEGIYSFSTKLYNVTQRKNEDLRLVLFCLCFFQMFLWSVCLSPAFCIQQQFSPVLLKFMFFSER